MRKFLLCLLMLLVCGGICFSTEIVLDEGDESEDNRLDNGDPTFNYGGHVNEYVGQQTTRVMKSIQRWDLSAIPAGATCDSAVLEMYDTDWANRSANCSISLYQIHSNNTGWVVGTANGAAQTGSVCWNFQAYDASSPTNWAGSAGCSTAGTDYINTVLATGTATDGASGWVSITFNSSGRTVLEGLFGGTGGDGFILVGGGVDNDWTEFYSSDYGTATNRPKLTINYTASDSFVPKVIILGD